MKAGGKHTQTTGSLYPIPAPVPRPHPSPSPPPPPNELPVSAACIRVVAADGNITQFCAADGETSTTYSAITPTAANWSTVLRKGKMKVLLSGSISVSSDLMLAGRAETLEWTLVSATTTVTSSTTRTRTRSSGGGDGSGLLAAATAAAVVVRAIDLGFGFVGLSSPSDQHYTTHQGKNWCPPRTGCQSWYGSSATCTIGGPPCTAEHIASYRANSNQNSNQSHSQIQSQKSSNGWQPPLPLPWAFSALQTPGRGSFAGGSSPVHGVGYSAWSSQPALPFQTFTNGGSSSSSSSSMPISISSGAARINANLRCGNVLPATLKFGFFADLTGDGAVNQDDGVVYSRQQYPLADWIYRSSLILKVDVDMTSYQQSASSPRIRFGEVLPIVKTLSAATDNTSLVVHLVGWQGSGHDTLYPSIDKVNPNVGTAAELRELAAASKAYNTIISYHINTDEAYINFTACGANDTGCKVHPVPGSDDGRRNPAFDPRIIAKQPGGQEWVWQAPHMSDPLQGPSFHISKTKDAATGLRWQRYADFLAAVPVDTTLHSDAYRDINDSWEQDERGFIAEDEEAICGLQGDKKYWGSKGLSFGVEGGNGALVALGPVPSFNGICDYYWHGHADLGMWNRIVTGSDQGCDNDISTVATSLKQLPLKDMYTKGLVLLMRMTDELLNENQQTYRNGGNATHWPYGGGLIQYRQDGGASVFVPAVEKVAAGSAKLSPTVLNLLKVRVFTSGTSGTSSAPPLGPSLSTGSRSTTNTAAARTSVEEANGDQTWLLPLHWVGKTIDVTAVQDDGSVQPGPRVSVNGRALTIHAMPVMQPVVLTVAPSGV